MYDASSNECKVNSAYTKCYVIHSYGYSEIFALNVYFSSRAN